VVVYLLVSHAGRVSDAQAVANRRPVGGISSRARLVERDSVGDGAAGRGSDARPADAVRHIRYHGHPRVKEYERCTGTAGFIGFFVWLVLWVCAGAARAMTPPPPMTRCPWHPVTVSGKPGCFGLVPPPRRWPA